MTEQRPPSDASFACQRLKRSAMKRKRGQNPSKRSSGELRAICLSTPAQEREVHFSHTFVQISCFSSRFLTPALTSCRSDTLLWPLSGDQAWPVSSLLCLRHVRHIYFTFDTDMFPKPQSPVLCARCVLKMDHHCPWYGPHSHCIIIYTLLPLNDIYAAKISGWRVYNCASPGWTTAWDSPITSFSSSSWPTRCCTACSSQPPCCSISSSSGRWVAAHARCGERKMQICLHMVARSNILWSGLCMALTSPLVSSVPSRPPPFKRRSFCPSVIPVVHHAHWVFVPPSLPIAIVDISHAARVAFLLWLSTFLSLSLFWPSFHQTSPLLNVCLLTPECLPPFPNCSLRPLLTSLVSVCAKALPEEIGRELSEGNPPVLQSPEWNADSLSWFLPFLSPGAKPSSLPSLLPFVAFTVVLEIRSAWICRWPLCSPSYSPRTSCPKLTPNSTSCSFSLWQPCSASAFCPSLATICGWSGRTGPL